MTLKVRILPFLTTFTQLTTRLKNYLRGWLLVLDLKEGLVECATVCVKSEVILNEYISVLSVLDKPDSAFWEDFLCYLNNLFLSFLSKNIPLEKEFDPPTNKLIEPENVWSRFWLSFIQTTHLGILLPVVSKGFVFYFNHLIDIMLIHFLSNIL